MHNISKIIFRGISFLLVFLYSWGAVLAEGSSSYCESGYRPFLTNGSHMYVYVEPGDTVYIGSSSYGSETDIAVTYPDGSKKDFDVTPENPGFIKDHQEEMLGPLSQDGYSPISFTSDIKGYMDIVFYASNLAAKNTNCGSEYKQCEKNNGCRIAAWDITVTDKDANIIPGRVFAKSFRFSDVNSRINGVRLYALTDDGHVYSFNTGAMTGIDWEISAANRGVVHIPSNMMVYASAVKDSEYKREYMPDIEYFGRFPEVKQTDKTEKTVDRTRASQDEGGKKSENTEKSIIKTQPFVPSFKYTKAGDISYRLFLSYPDSKLLEKLGLDNPKAAPTVSDFVFTPYEDGSVGGQFSFISNNANNDYGTYEIRIYSEDPSFEPVILGNRLQSHNTVDWDGKDRYGNTLTAQSFTAQLRVRSGEIHFALDDIEYLYDGVKVRLENGQSAGKTTVYYDNRDITVNGHSTGLNRYLCNDGDRRCEPFSYSVSKFGITMNNKESPLYLTGAIDRTEGVDSYKEPAMKTDKMYSDGLLLDVYSYPEEFNTYEISFDFLPEAEITTNIPDMQPDGNSDWFFQVNTEDIPFVRKFTKLEYIAAAGKSYIDTGIKPNDDIGFTAVFEVIPGNSEQYLLRNGAKCESGCLSFRYDPKTERGVFIYNDLGISTSVTPYSKQIISFVNGTFFGTTGNSYNMASEGGFPSDDNIIIYGNNEDTGAIKVYSLVFFVKDQSAVVLTPCQSRFGSGEGLCDYKNETFFRLSFDK